MLAVVVDLVLHMCVNLHGHFCVVIVTCSYFKLKVCCCSQTCYVAIG